MPMPRVVIVGAGFGGLACAKALKGKPVEALIVDRNNYHLFTPLLYQVASSLLNPSDITRPVRSLFRGVPNVRFRQGEVTGVDFEGHGVIVDGTEAIPFDYLVVAVGSTTNYFGLASVEGTALGLKDLPEALELRNHILRCLERAATLPADERAEWLTFVVAGGGPTGVEYAGALSELLRLVRSEYPELAGDAFRIVLIEGLPDVLPSFPPSLRDAARRELERKGIEVRTQTRVAGAGPGAVTLASGEVVHARTITWAAGVRPASFAGTLEVPHSRSGRIEVDDCLRVAGHPGAFAIGDVAAARAGGGEIPMLSAPAMQEGRNVAANILRAVRGEELRPFAYRDRGSMATIGKNVAVASIGPVRLGGFAGWVLWLAVHLYYLIGFRNRLAVLGGWAWNYIRSDRPVRIIARAKGRP